MQIEVWKKKKQDETGHFSNGIQCAAMARDTNIRVSFCLCSMFSMLYYQTVFLFKMKYE